MARRLPLERGRGSLEGRRGQLFVGPLRFFGPWAFLCLWAAAMQGVICSCGFDRSLLSVLRRGDFPRY
jgi:hypothetical protein